MIPRRLQILAFVLGSLLSRPALPADPPPGEAAFHVGFVRSLFTDVNESDVKAALGVWAQTIAAERHIPTRPEPTVFRDGAAMEQAVVGGTVDAVGISLLDYWHLHQQVALGPLMVLQGSGTITERYHLVVRRDGKVRRPADLAGKHVVLHSNLRSAPARLWFDLYLREQQLPRLEMLTASVSFESKLTKVLLPVFFGRADACLVSRGGMLAMTELNPNVARQLEALVSSEEYIPMVFGFRPGYRPSYHPLLMDALRDLHRSPAGQQVLMFFHSEALRPIQPAELQPSLELVARYHETFGHDGEHPSPTLSRSNPTASHHGAP